MYRNGFLQLQKDVRYKTRFFSQARIAFRNIRKGLWEAHPRPVQEEAIPNIILHNRIVLARTKNGMGEAAAYIISCLEKIDASRNYDIQSELVRG